MSAVLRKRRRSTTKRWRRIRRRCHQSAFSLRHDFVDWFDDRKKAAPTGYSLFRSAQIQSNKSLPSGFIEQGRALGELWNKLSDAQKQVQISKSFAVLTPRLRNTRIRQQSLKQKVQRLNAALIIRNTQALTSVVRMCAIIHGGKPYLVVLQEHPALPAVLLQKSCNSW